jgi:hypothetical protein
MLIEAAFVWLLSQSAGAQPEDLARQANGKGEVVISGELKQWHKVTLTLAGPFARERDTQPNPFCDYAFSVRFTHESGSPSYIVPGYFAADGGAGESSAESGTKWRAHLAPDKAGTWSYAVSFASGRNVALEGGGNPLAPFDGISGSLKVDKTDKAGRDFRAQGRLQYVGRHHLQFAGTEQFFLKAGPDAPETLLAYEDFDGTSAGKPAKAPLKTWEPHMRDWRPGAPSWRGGRGKGLIGALNYLAGKGVNSLSFLTYNAAGDGDNVWPFVAREAKLHYDCSKLDQWGVVFDHATARGLHLHFKLQENEMDDNRLGSGRKAGDVPEALDGGRLDVERKLYCRELVARFGHALALNWNIGEENTQSSDEVRAMAKYLRDVDPYGHPVVLHTFPSEQERVYRPLLGDKSALTGVSLQNAWNNVHLRTLQWLRESASSGRPWVVANDEQNPAGLGVPPDPGYKGHSGLASEEKVKGSEAEGNVASKPYSSHDIRKLTLWGNLMAGGAGVEYYFGYALPENDLLAQDFRSRDRSWDYCRIALEFFRTERIPFWEMVNRNALVGNLKDDNSRYCLAKPDDVYLVYLPNGGSTDLDLAAARGAFAVRWFNPRDGGDLRRGTVESVKAGASVTLGQPPSDTSEDWLVVIRRSAAEPKRGALTAKVGRYKGRSVIFVNGKPMAPLMYSGTEHSRETWAGQPRESIEAFSALGYEIIQTDMWFKYSLRPDGTFDVAGIRRQLAGILEVSPDAKLVVRINVSAPRWWLEQHPAERCKTTVEKPEKDVFGGNSAESLASEEYAAFAGRYLKLFLEQLSQTPEGDRVIGFHIGGGVYGEWHYYGIYNEPDASEPMQKRFSALALARYGSLERVNVAWKTAFATLSDLSVPSFARRYELADGDFRDPQQDRYVIDYYECQQAVVASLVSGLAKIAKEAWPRPAIVGLFYGYFYGGWTVGAQASQSDIKTLFRSPYVDYFSGPYASRNMLGSGVPRSLVQSVALNGKVWITEHDGGSHLGHVGDVKFPDLPRDEAESIARMRRNFMYGLTDNAGQWWYDFGPKNRSGTWNSPAMLAEAKALLDLANARLEQPYEKPSDVLVVYDMDAYNLMRPAKADRLTSKITEALTDSLLGTGAAVDRIFLMDLDAVDLSRYKLVIFGNTFILTDTQRDLIKRRVMTSGRTVVFMSGAGTSDGRTSGTARMSDLVGMQLEKAAEPESRVAVAIGAETADLDAHGVVSRYRIDDAGARAIGTYPSGAVAAAVKTVNGCQVYYFGVPLKAPLPILKALLREAGVRVWLENTAEQDYVTVGGGIIGVYSVRGGDKAIKPLTGNPIPVSLPPYSAQFFDLSTGAPLNKITPVNAD